MPEDSCANPLLRDWVNEWYEEARQRNSKGMPTYKKALEAIKACPVAFEHPSQARELRGLGPKLCDRLTDKLKAHCAANNLPMPQDPRMPKKKRTSDQVNNTAAEDQTEDASAPPPKKARKTKPKQYVPTLRSGAYAIMLALSTLPESGGSGLSKTSIIELAQPYCDASFTTPVDTGKTYTAWSSMKTLQTKDLVYMSGGARKQYLLTDEGWEVARKVKTASGLSDEAIRDPLASGGAVRVEDSRADQLPSSQPLPPLPPLRQPSLPPATVTSESSRPRAKKACLVDLDDFSDDEPPRPRTKTPEPLQPRQKKSSGLLRSYTENDFVEILSSSPRLLPSKPKDPRPPLHSTSGNKTLPPDLLKPPASTNTRPQPTPTQPSIPSFTPITIPPSSYTIELLLDNREVRSKSDRDYIQSSLLTYGIRPTTRSLPLGDALWVARLTNPHLLPSHGEEGNEIILDYILERKRLDDLIGSIKDGRFDEQKFRLRRSGVAHSVYLIEDFNLGQDTRDYYHKHLCSAVASTMVVGGMFVKRTASLDASIGYLARMTRLLREHYAGRTLSVIPSAVIKDTSALAGIRASSPHAGGYLTYDAFANLSSKTDSLTLKDVYLKMLMCVRGLTGEKAIEVQKIWPTPADLLRAMRERDEKGRRELVWEKLGSAVGKKKVGKALSGKVAEVWGGLGG